MFKYVNGICPSNFTFEYKTFNGPYSYRAQDSLILKQLQLKRSMVKESLNIMVLACGTDCHIRCVLKKILKYLRKN